MINCPRTSLMNWSWLFKQSWIVLSTGYITIQWISIWETTIHWIEIYLVDSAIHLLNNWGLNYKSCMAR